jgi:hypothetical protein
MQKMLSGDAVLMAQQQLEQGWQTSIPVLDRGVSDMSACQLVRDSLGCTQPMQAAEQRRYVIVATGMKDQPRGSVHHDL